MKSVLKHDHVYDCFAIKSETWDNPWCLDYRRPHETADKNGGGRGFTTSWIRVRCLDPSCTALMLVREFDLWTLAEKELP